MSSRKEQVCDTMVEVAVLDLNDPRKWNHWVIGTPEEVPESSPFHSEQLQIKYNKNPEKEHFLETEEEHWHTSPIEEYYFVLEGTLKVKIENKVFHLEPMQMLPVPPDKRHKVLDFSLPIQYFTIRAPSSSKRTKIVVERR